MESLNPNLQERELHQLQQMQDKAKESCMTSFRLLHSHLKVLSINDLKRLGFEGGYERAFALALSISKMKASHYPDFGLELLVPEQMWIDENQSLFKIRYDYLSEIVLRRADLQEHKIAKKDFKNLYPSNFEDLNLLLLQGDLDHLSGSDKCMISTVLNLTKPRWGAKGFKFKHDYTIIESPCVVVFPVNNNERKIMRFNEMYKFSDGTLTRILEALDYRVKEYRVNRLNP
nr:hypothetical protein [Tanacetum cinerariifolium]